jgi:hypothetical protein
LGGYDLGECVLVGVADDHGHAWESGDFFRGALRVATCDHDLGAGILAAYAADGGAGVLVRAGSHGAGVHYYHGGLGGSGGAGHAALFELAFEGGAVGLRGAAAEVFYVVSGHLVMLAHCVRGNPHFSQKDARSGAPGEN